MSRVAGRSCIVTGAAQGIGRAIGEALLDEGADAEAADTLRRVFDRREQASLLFAADKGIPALYNPAPLAGGTAPITTAGHVAVALASVRKHVGHRVMNASHPG